MLHDVLSLFAFVMYIVTVLNTMRKNNGAHSVLPANVATQSCHNGDRKDGRKLEDVGHDSNRRLELTAKKTHVECSSWLLFAS